jgi:hypothetical protein
LSDYFSDLFKMFFCLFRVFHNSLPQIENTIKSIYSPLKVTTKMRSCQSILAGYLVFSADSHKPCSDINDDGQVDISVVILTLRMALDLDEKRLCT